MDYIFKLNVSILLMKSPQGKALISGGSFGPEGGIIVTIFTWRELFFFALHLHCTGKKSACDFFAKEMISPTFLHCSAFLNKPASVDSFTNSSQLL